MYQVPVTFCSVSRAKLKHDRGITRVMNSSIPPLEIARWMNLAIVTSRAVIAAVEDQGGRSGGYELSLSDLTLV